MSSRRAALKTTLLLAPLFVSIFTLHAWGDPASAGLGRAVGHWQYPERTHGIFQIRVPRGSDADSFAARALDEIVSRAIKTHGVELVIHHPLQPIKVVLIHPDTTELRRFGWTVAETLKENEGFADTARRTIFVRMERKLQRDPVIAALQLGAARLLLHDAGSERWEPWLTEGLVGRLEGTPLMPQAWTADPPLTLKDLLGARPADFQGRAGQAYVRGARLLVAYLMEKRADDFAKYYRSVRLGAPNPQEIFDDKFYSHAHLESDWREWIRAQK